PGGGNDAGQNHEPLDIDQLLSAGFWSQLAEAGEGPTQAATMVRPVGGMSKIAEAIARSVANVITYNAAVTRLRRRGTGARVEWMHVLTGKASTIGAQHVLVTIQDGLGPFLDHADSPRVDEAVATPDS